MDIAATTKISSLIKENPDAVEAIASISSHFEKLRNPLLRKLLASRVTIADAARIGGCKVEAFYEKLAPLGFTVSSSQGSTRALTAEAGPRPAALAQLPPENIITLDVREAIAAGHDPFQRIMGAVQKLNSTNALLLVNTFEPTPLFAILAKKGYAAYAEVQGPDLVHTYFWLSGGGEATPSETKAPNRDFEQLLHRFGNSKVRSIDVRHLEMPQPMVTILGELEQMPPGEALYVTHRRVPQFLLPQLEERGFTHAIREVGPAEVHLLIYKAT
ncbi:hypothetical protein GCM10023188_42350 [Pontibacter saemangeumensis]|uniref:DUF2249 domain-containing protein n=1 Tax=Pontibacter saemangeumensis TaxID=1084525 RepID=A0ABP8M1C5_9BACT